MDIQLYLTRINNICNQIKYLDQFTIQRLNSNGAHPHIIKPPVQDFQGVVTNGVYWMSLTKNMGFDVPDIEILNVWDISLSAVISFQSTPLIDTLSGNSVQE